MAATTVVVALLNIIHLEFYVGFECFALPFQTFSVVNGEEMCDMCGGFACTLAHSVKTLQHLIEENMHYSTRVLHALNRFYFSTALSTFCSDGCYV